MIVQSVATLGVWCANLAMLFWIYQGARHGKGRGKR